LGAAGCRKKESAKDQQAYVGIPADAGVVAKVLNPSGKVTEEGETGSVFGVIHVKGDTAPETPEALTKLPPECVASREMYGHLFREGPGRTLADALVAVTGYQGFRPAPTPAVNVEAKDCVFQSRTVAVTFGQRLDVYNKGTRSYGPILQGLGSPVALYAIPNGPPIPLTPMRPGLYRLRDAGLEFMSADVYVVKYSTVGVTGLDGAYRIDGVPTGDATVNVLLPATGAVAEGKVKVVAGQRVRLDLDLEFSLAQWAAQRDAARAAASATATGSASATATGTASATATSSAH